MANPPSLVGRPFAQANWLASRMGGTARELYEVTLHSDARVVGELSEGLGPYQVLNLVPDDPLFGSSRAIAAVRISNYLENTEPSMDYTDTSTYHGATFWEELASLLSLALGIRLRAGGVIRDFTMDDDPYGRPHAELLSDRPLLVTSTKSRVIPSLMVQRNWSDASAILSAYPDLSAKAAVRLVRAARSYQNALWIADTDPTLAWLLFVAAVESPAALLGGGAKNRFVEFIIKHSPSPPDRRPPEGMQLNWDEHGLRDALEKVYGLRSMALHEAVPFPWPMCEAPYKQEEWEAPAERFFAIAAHGRGGSWLAEDLPMFLHSFEYLVRGALIGWWTAAVTAN